MYTYPPKKPLSTPQAALTHGRGSLRGCRAPPCSVLHIPITPSHVPRADSPSSPPPSAYAGGLTCPVTPAHPLSTTEDQTPLPLSSGAARACLPLLPSPGVGTVQALPYLIEPPRKEKNQRLGTKQNQNKKLGLGPGLDTPPESRRAQSSCGEAALRHPRGSARRAGHASTCSRWSGP